MVDIHFWSEQTRHKWECQMKPKKAENVSEPEYPSRRQFVKYGIMLGVVAAVGASSGCRMPGVLRPADRPTVVGDEITAGTEITTTGGLPPVEPPLELGGKIRAEPTVAGDSATSATRDGTTIRYTIRSGDTLSRIAKDRLGSARRVDDILDLNPGIKPNMIKVGQVILLPKSAGETQREPVKLGGKPAR